MTFSFILDAGGMEPLGSGRNENTSLVSILKSKTKHLSFVRSCQKPYNTPLSNISIRKKN
jgi:hypothetical protein